MPGIRKERIMKPKDCQSPGKLSQPAGQVEAASARPSARGAQRPAGSRARAEQGTPPSNTVPNNSNGEYFRPLRWGVDSLYLSYTGELLPEVVERLSVLKALAQSIEPGEQARAQYPLAGHIFEVKDKGASLFPYVLEDGAFRIQLSKGGKLPMAYVKVSSTYLSHVTPAVAEQALYAVLQLLGTLLSPAQVSRIDLFVDFVWNGSMDWPREAWVTRAVSIDNYSENGIFTGWVIGKGGVMLGRLYYKLLQATKIGADYLLTLWQQAGWQAGEDVWRQEFQIKRDALKQMGLSRLPEVIANLNGLWSYAMTEWLKLTIPNAADKTRSRWPIHPLWGYLSAVDWETEGGPLTRMFEPTRVPSDDRLYSLFLASLLGYSAKRGILDLHQGYEAMIADVVQFYMGKAYALGLSFDDYIAERLSIKTRLFNTLVNDSELIARIDAEILEAKAEAYRKASKG